MKKIFFGFCALLLLAVVLIEMAREGLPLMSFLHSLHHLSEEPGDSSQSGVEKVSSAGVPSAKVLSKEEDEFGSFLRDVASALPQVERRAERHPDITQAPREFRTLGPLFGKIADEVKENPDFISQALSFFESCTRREDTFTAVRAVCLWNLRKLSAEINRPGLLDESIYAPEVRTIADRLSR